MLPKFEGPFLGPAHNKQRFKCVCIYIYIQETCTWVCVWAPIHGNPMNRLSKADLAFVTSDWERPNSGRTYLPCGTLGGLWKVQTFISRFVSLYTCLSMYMYTYDGIYARRPKRSRFQSSEATKARKEPSEQAAKSSSYEPLGAELESLEAYGQTLLMREFQPFSGLWTLHPTKLVIFSEGQALLSYS